MKHQYHPRTSRPIPFLFPSASSTSSTPWTVCHLPLLPKLLSPDLGYVGAGYAYAFGHEIWDSRWAHRCRAHCHLPGVHLAPSWGPMKMRVSLSSRCCSPSTSSCTPSTRALSLGCSPRCLPTSRWCQHGEVVFVINVVPLCVLVLLVRHWDAARNAYPRVFRFQHAHGRHGSLLPVTGNFSFGYCDLHLRFLPQPSGLVLT
jgi:hypothetical protein